MLTAVNIQNFFFFGQEHLVIYIKTILS